MPFEEFNINYIQVLLKISNKLGISPPINNGLQSNLKKYKALTVMLLLILTIGTSIGTYGKIKIFFPKIKNSSAVLNLVRSFTICLLNVITVLVAFFNVSNWNNLINLFNYIDKNLNKTTPVTNNAKKYLKIKLIFFHAVLATIFIYDIFIWSSEYGWELFKFTMFKYFLFYHVFITAIVLLHFASSLRIRFRRINNFLTKTNDLHNMINYFIPSDVPQRVNNIKSIKEVTDYFLILSELVEIFNKLFGWQIFFLTESIILLLLECFNNLMIILDSKINSTHEQSTIFFLASYSSVLIFFHTKLILACEGVNSESRGTLSTCYKLEQTVDPNSEERKELLILSDVVNLVKPRTSAAGFYLVNRSLLSRVLASLFAYSIVLIQFNKQT